MNTDALYPILNDCTKMFRKGDEVEQSGMVTDIFMMPPESEAVDLIMVDVFFMMVGVDKVKAVSRRDELAILLSDYARLKDGPSYIEVGAELGSQDAALQLFALGKMLGFWQVITPETLGIKGQDAWDMAGSGFIMVSGFNPS